MATVDECRNALRSLTGRLAENAAQNSTRVDLDRTIAIRVSDLGIAFHGRLSGGQIVAFADGDDPSAKLALTAQSDDLVALIEERLSATAALASGKIKIDASIFDMLKLRKLL